MRPPLSLVLRLCPCLCFFSITFSSPCLSCLPMLPPNWLHLLHPYLSHLLSTLLHQSRSPLCSLLQPCWIRQEVLHLLPHSHSLGVQVPIPVGALPVQLCLSESCPGSPGREHAPSTSWLDGDSPLQSSPSSLSLYLLLFIFSFLSSCSLFSVALY